MKAYQNKETLFKSEENDQLYKIESIQVFDNTGYMQVDLQSVEDENESDYINCYMYLESIIEALEENGYHKQ